MDWSIKKYYSSQPGKIYLIFKFAMEKNIGCVTVVPGHSDSLIT